MNGLLNQALLSNAGLSGIAGGAIIKTVQRGLITEMPSTSLEITIPDVDIDKSVLLVTNFRGGNAYWNQILGELTASNKITLSRYDATATTGLQLGWQLLEFSNIKSIQKGKDVMSSPDYGFDITISPVDMQKSIVFLSSKNDSTSTNASYGVRYELTGATTLRRTNNITGNVTAVWYVVEF